MRRMPTRKAWPTCYMVSFAVSKVSFLAKPERKVSLSTEDVIGRPTLEDEPSGEFSRESPKITTHQPFQRGDVSMVISSINT